MKRILSVDWDYFINATMEQRMTLFPDGGYEGLPTSIRDFIWDTYYNNPSLRRICVKSDYRVFLKICREFNGPCMIMDSHKYAFDFIDRLTKSEEKIELYNIDFHHDLYGYTCGDERVNCGNWINCIMEDRPNLKYTWIKQDDSDDKVSGPEMFTTMTMKDFIHKFGRTFSDAFDALYICRSSVWSPPHLDKSLVKGLRILLDHCPAQYEEGILTPRFYDVPGNVSYYKAYASLVDLSKKMDSSKVVRSHLI